MADTVDLREIEELVDAPELFAAHVDRLAAMLLDAKRAVIFTGAGVSTASGIADYRGPDGVWTRKAQGRAPPKSVNMVAAAPTLAHRAIARLVATGRVRYLVSQNVDGLHLKSGVPRDSISELHGDVKLEVCWKCDASYLRDFNVVEHKNGNGRCGECKKRVKHFCHCTSRRCACGAVLKDSIINFGENLPDVPMERADAACRSCDLVICVGSSLRVTPAADLPANAAARGAKLVIINLQRTPLDGAASLVMHSRIDETFAGVMAAMGDAEFGASEAEAMAEAKAEEETEPAMVAAGRAGTGRRLTPERPPARTAAPAGVGRRLTPKRPPAAPAAAVRPTAGAARTTARPVAASAPSPAAAAAASGGPGA